MTDDPTVAARIELENLQAEIAARKRLLGELISQVRETTSRLAKLQGP